MTEPAGKRGECKLIIANNKFNILTFLHSKKKLISLFFIS